MGQIFGGGSGTQGPRGPKGDKGDKGDAGDLASLPQAIDSEASPSFDKIYVTNNGEGTNVKIGDDAWIGDVNEANHIAIQGVEDSDAGGVIFGSDYSNRISANANDLSLQSSNDIILNPGSSYAYLGSATPANRIATLSDIPDSALADAVTVTYTTPYKTWSVPTSNVNSTLNIVTLFNHGLSNGDAVVYMTGGGSPIAPLTGGSTYYVRVYDANAVYLYDTAAHAINTAATTGLKDLGATGTNAQYFTTQGAGATTAVNFNGIDYETFVISTSLTGGLTANFSADLNNGQSKELRLIVPGGTSNYTFTVNQINSQSVTPSSITLVANTTNVFEVILIKLNESYSAYVSG